MFVNHSNSRSFVSSGYPGPRKVRHSWQLVRDVDVNYTLSLLGVGWGAGMGLDMIQLITRFREGIGDAGVFPHLKRGIENWKHNLLCLSSYGQLVVLV